MGLDGEPAPTLVLPLNKTTTVTARRTSVRKAETGYVWHGVIEDTDDMVTLLGWPDGRLSGTVNYKGHVYAVKPMGGAARRRRDVVGGLAAGALPNGKETEEKNGHARGSARAQGSCKRAAPLRRH